MNILKAQLTSITMALTLGVISPVCLKAQDAPLPPPQNFERGLGLKTDDWSLYNRIQTGIQSTTNVRQDPTEKSDYKTLFSAIAVAQSTWDKHALAFNASYAYQDALDTENQKNDALSGSVSGRIDLTPMLNLKLGFLHTESIVAKNDPEEFSGNLNGETTEDTIEGSIGWVGDSHFIDLQTRYDQVDNTTDIDVTGLARTQIQDRDEWNTTLQIGQKFNWGKAYILAGSTIITYDGSEVILPEDRDSEGGRIGLGLNYVKDKFRADASIIGFSQYFDADTIGPITDYVGLLQASYSLSSKLSVAAKLQRTFDETNITGSAGLFTNLVSAAAQYEFNKDLYVKLGPSYRFYEIENTTWEVEEVQFDATLGWNLMKNVEFLVNGTAYTQTANDAAISTLEYDEIAVTFSTVITF